MGAVTIQEKVDYTINGKNADGKCLFIYNTRNVSYKYTPATVAMMLKGGSTKADILAQEKDMATATNKTPNKSSCVSPTGKAVANLLSNPQKTMGTMDCKSHVDLPGGESTGECKLPGGIVCTSVTK